jgi:hypothetical protein
MRSAKLAQLTPKIVRFAEEKRGKLLYAAKLAGRLSTTLCVLKTRTRRPIHHANLAEIFPASLQIFPASLQIFLASLQTTKTSARRLIRSAKIAYPPSPSVQIAQKYARRECQSHSNIPKLTIRGLDPQDPAFNLEE